MKIPKQFTLGAVVWTVEEKDPLLSALGATHSALGKVELLKTMPPQIKKQTYCHELVHCIMYAMGKSTHDEEFVDAFATFLHQYLEQYHK